MFRSQRTYEADARARRTPHRDGGVRRHRRRRATRRRRSGEHRHVFGAGRARPGGPVPSTSRPSAVDRVTQTTDGALGREHWQNSALAPTPPSAVPHRARPSARRGRWQTPRPTRDSLRYGPTSMPIGRGRRLQRRYDRLITALSGLTKPLARGQRRPSSCADRSRHGARQTEVGPQLVESRCSRAIIGDTPTPSERTAVQFLDAQFVTSEELFDQLRPSSSAMTTRTYA